MYPPSTQIVCPKHIVQASLLRNTTMLAISQGSTKRPIGVLSSMGRDLAGSPHVLMPMSDHATVGAMLFTCNSKTPSMTIKITVCRTSMHRSRQ